MENGPCVKRTLLHEPACTAAAADKRRAIILAETRLRAITGGGGSVCIIVGDVHVKR